MASKVIIEIFCSKDECQDCNLLEKISDKFICKGYHYELRFDKNETVFRCSECKNAEVPESKVKARCAVCLTWVYASELQVITVQGADWNICNKCRNVEIGKSIPNQKKINNIELFKFIENTTGFYTEGKLYPQDMCNLTREE